jgi:sporulation protein YqfC
MKNTKKTKKQRRTLGELIDMPLGAGYDGVRVELLGDREAIVSGCRGVCEYNPERVILKLKRQFLHIGGTHLDCITYLDKTVEVRGNIESILFYADKVKSGDGE